MSDYLIVVDMQKDFISGSLGTPEAQAIVVPVIQKICGHKGPLYFTRDTHEKNYLESHEGQRLPVEHCLKGSPGWELHPELYALAQAFQGIIVDKPALGSIQLAELLAKRAFQDCVDSITLVVLCTDICVISNALLLRSYFPEADISVDAACCAGVTPQSHQRALETMKLCHIDILNEET